MFHGYYKKLYTLHDGDKILQDQILAQTEACKDQKPDDKLTFEIGYIKQVLSNTSNNKTPGHDGIPVEFYKRFFSELSDELMGLFQRSMTKK